jgi:hypothetical protein
METCYGVLQPCRCLPLLFAFFDKLQGWVKILFEFDLCAKRNSSFDLEVCGEKGTN